MNTAIAPNKRLDEIYGYVQGLTDAQLAQLVQKNPESTEATLALGQIQSRNDFRQRAQGQQGEAPTVKEGILGLATNQNNQDPRLMAGMGSMPMTPRDSMDTPMNGIASLPAQQMQMADGGIVGYAEGDLIEEPFDPRSLMVEMGPDGMPATPAYDLEDSGLNSAYQWVKDNPAKAAEYASYGLMFVPGVGLAGLAARGVGKYALPKIASGAKKLFTRPGKQVRSADLSMLPTTGKRSLRKLRTAGTASTVAGLGGIAALGEGEEAPLETMRGLREMGPSRGSEAIAPAAPAEKADRKRYPNLGNFLQAAGLSYASGKNLGESGIAGLGYMDDQKALESKMTDREQLEFARETAIMEAQMKAMADSGLTGTEVKDVLTYKEGLTASSPELNNQAATILAQYNGDLAAFGQAYQITAGKEAIQQKLMEVARDTLVNNRMQSFLSKGVNLARDVSAPDIPTTVVR